MTHTLSEEETKELRAIVTHPVFKKALELALGELWADKRGATTTEQSALNYQFHDGACSLVNKLLFHAEVRESAAITPRRLRHHA